jgi:hypothetical protein
MSASLTQTYAVFVSRDVTCLTVVTCSQPACHYACAYRRKLTPEKIAILERENQSLRREVERLRRLLGRRCEPPSVKQRRSLAQARKRIRPSGA